MKVRSNDTDIRDVHTIFWSLPVSSPYGLYEIPFLQTTREVLTKHDENSRNRNIPS